MLHSLLAIVLNQRFKKTLFQRITSKLIAFREIILNYIEEST